MKLMILLLSSVIALSHGARNGLVRVGVPLLLVKEKDSQNVYDHTIFDEDIRSVYRGLFDSTTSSLSLSFSFSVLPVAPPPVSVGSPIEAPVGLPDTAPPVIAPTVAPSPILGNVSLTSNSTVALNATLSPNATIAPNATLAPNATIAPNATLAANDTTIILNATIVPNSTGVSFNEQQAETKDISGATESKLSASQSAMIAILSVAATLVVIAAFVRSRVATEKALAGTDGDASTASPNSEMGPRVGHLKPIAEI